MPLKMPGHGTYLFDAFAPCRPVPVKMTLRTGPGSFSTMRPCVLHSHPLDEKPAVAALQLLPAGFLRSGLGSPLTPGCSSALGVCIAHTE
jgi:hypothetical protein